MSSILVIGGGLTGLVAAKELSAQGNQVTLIEAGPSLGGLASSFELGGEPLEKAYHHLFRTDHDILDLIDELGIKDKLEWKESSVAIYREEKVWPFMTALDLIKFKPCSLIGRIRLGLAALYIKYSKNWKKFADRTAMQWMQNICGASAMNAVWRPLLRGKFAHHADDISMAWLWARLHVRSNSREPSGSGECLGYIRGGFIQLVNALNTKLVEQGVKIRLSEQIKKVSPIADGSIMIETEVDSLRYDQVLFTGSNLSFEKLLTNTPSMSSYRKSLSAIDYLGAMCLVFTTDQKLGDHYWVNINEEEAPFLVFIRHTKLIEPERYGGKEVYYIGAYCDQDRGIFNHEDTEITKQWFDYLKILYPEFDKDSIEGEYLFKFKNAQHVVKRGYEDKILNYKTPVDGLFLANFTQIYPEDRGTNFAVREGKKVSELMLRS